MIIRIFLWQISKYLLPLESGNLQLEQTKFPVFWQNFQITCVFPDRVFSFPCFLCAVGTLLLGAKHLGSLLTQHVLLDLLTDRQRVRVHEVHVTRDLEVRQLQSGTRRWSQGFSQDRIIASHPLCPPFV